MTKDKPRFELSAAQVIGGALAAASAAVAASMLGVAGTVIGAAVASVVTTVGSAMYTHSVRRGRYAIEHARTVRLSRVRHPDAGPAPKDTTTENGTEETTAPMPADRAVDDDVADETTAAMAAGETARAEPETAESEPETEAQQPTEPDERPSGWRDRLRGLNGKRLAVTAACALVLALGVITGAEAIIGQPISSALKGGKDGGGTSIGSLAEGHAGSGTTRSPSKTPTPSVTRTVTETPTTTSTYSPRRTSATPSPSRPSSTRPTSNAPTPAPTTPTGSATRPTPGGLLP